MSELEAGYYWVKNNTSVATVLSEWTPLEYLDGYFWDGYDVVMPDAIAVIGPRIQPPEE